MKTSVLILLLVITACHKSQKEDPCAHPQWVQKQIDFYEMQVGDPTAKLIVRYRYQGQYVFYFDNCHSCADAMQLVMNCKRDTICMFGGIAGINTCPDFYHRANDSTLVYKNF